MSINRDIRRTLPNDVLDFAERATRPRTITVSPDAVLVSRRKARPLNILLSTTAAWVQKLPLDVQPQVLCDRFPRIANALSSAWPDSERARAYFAELLVDSRGGRQGFPKDVLRELLALQTYFQTEHPETSDTWDGAR
jgi:hypothetical protein